MLTQEAAITMVVRRKFSRGGQCQHFSHPFQVADDAMHMDVHKTLYPFYTAKKISHESTRSICILVEIVFK